MNTGILYAALAYVAWGLFPLYFKQVADVPSLEVVMHRTLWSLAVVPVSYTHLTLPTKRIV